MRRLGTLVTLASTFVPSKVACTYTCDASQLNIQSSTWTTTLNILRSIHMYLYKSRCSCMQFWALQRPVNSLMTFGLVITHILSTNLLPILDAYYNITHLSKSSKNMCLNDHPRSSPRTFWALSPPSLLEDLLKIIYGDFIVDGLFLGVFRGFQKHRFPYKHLINQPCLQRTVGHNHVLFFSPNGETPRVQTPVPTMSSYPPFITVMGHPLPLTFPPMASTTSMPRKCTSPTNHTTCRTRFLD